MSNKYFFTEENDVYPAQKKLGKDIIYLTILGKLVIVILMFKQ